MYNNNPLVKSLFIAGKLLFLNWIMVCAFAVLNSLGCLMIKSEIHKISHLHLATPKSIISYFLTLFSSWKTWLGFTSIGLGTGAWMISLAHIELSKAYPVAIGLNLLIIVSISLIRFHEPLTFCKMLGIFFIFIGIFFVVR